MDVEHDMIEVSGITLHVAMAGPEDGPPVILLHGFPEFWYMWRPQLEGLGKAGFRAIAPDQRGINLSDKPKGVSAYGMDSLAGDVVGLADALGYEKVRLVGHDWGGVIAWWVANKYPDRLEQLVSLCTPHHRVMGRALRTDPDQRRRSRYMLFFQIPVLPEIVLRFNRWSPLIEGLMGRDTRPGTFSEADLDAYREAWSQPGAMTGGINWYRALRRVRPERLPSPRITVPTLMISATEDAYFSPALAQPSIDLCDDGRLVYLDGATHWVAQERPDELNRLLIDFFSEMD